MALEPHPVFHTSLASNLIASALLLVTLFIIRLLIEQRIQRQQHRLSHEELLRRVGNVRTGFSLIVIPALAYIWAAAIYAFAISLVAVALACVVAMKELLICFWGYLTLLRGRFYSLGNRIELAGWRGDVVDIRWLSTTLLEVTPRREGDQRTGRRLCMPNALLLNHAVYNESSLGTWTIMMIQVSLSREIDPQQAIDCLLDAASTAVQPFLHRAQEELKVLESRRRVTLPPSTPHVYVELVSFEEYKLRARMPAPLSQQESLEATVMQRFVENMYAKRLYGS